MSLLLRVLMVVLAGVLVSCQGGGEREAEGDTSEPAAVGDTVALTAYLRTGSSSDAMLRPVAREVVIEGNLTQRAVELLLEGPTAEEDGLESPWPEGTEVRSVSVDEGVATVDLSAQALDGVNSEDAAHLEVLALGAMANTLTEFPTIERVRLTVEGESAEDSDAVAAFWGGWGMPPLLARDETLVGESTPSTPVLSEFMASQQSVGSEDAAPVRVRSVRVRDRITYVRLVIELGDAADPDASAPAFPRAYARTQPDGVVFELTDVDTIDRSGLPTELDERLRPYLKNLDVGDGRRPNSMRLTLESDTAGSRGIRLHTRDSPSRIVLDIRK